MWQTGQNFSWLLTYLLFWIRQLTEIPFWPIFLAHSGESMRHKYIYMWLTLVTHIMIKLIALFFAVNFSNRFLSVLPYYKKKIMIWGKNYEKSKIGTWALKIHVVGYLKPFEVCSCRCLWNFAHGRLFHGVTQLLLKLKVFGLPLCTHM